MICNFECFYNLIYFCYSLVNFVCQASVVIYEGVTTIPNDAYKNCAILSSLLLPSTLLSIGDHAFYGTSLTSATIPNSVTTIGQYAFNNISTLTSVTLGSGLTSIGDRAFASTAITCLTYSATIPSISYGSSVFLNTGCTGAPSSCSVCPCKY